MKVFSPLPVGIKEQAPSAPNTRSPAESAPKSAPGVRPPAGAEVELSPTAASLRSSTASADFDAAKVERIGQSIAEGRFKVDADAIADKLIANARELLGKVRR